MKRASFEKIVRRLIEASVSESWKGSFEPEEMDNADEELKEAKAKYKKAMDSEFEPATLQALTEYVTNMIQEDFGDVFPITKFQLIERLAAAIFARKFQVQ